MRRTSLNLFALALALPLAATTTACRSGELGEEDELSYDGNRRAHPSPESPFVRGDDRRWDRPEDTGTFEPAIEVAKEAPRADAASCEAATFDPSTISIKPDKSDSMGSPTHTRELLRMGEVPHRAHVRTHEFLNYYTFDYERPAPGQTVAVYPEMMIDSENAGLTLNVGIRAQDPTTKRRPMLITLAVDTSPSMNGEAMDRQLTALKAIHAQLMEDDIVNLVVRNADEPVILSGHRVTGVDDHAVWDAIKSITADGDGNLTQIVRTAYELANEWEDGSGKMNRVFLFSDGDEELNEYDLELVRRFSADDEREGIHVVGIGTGPADGYFSGMMNDLTIAGRGSYVYLDSNEEATRVFSNRLSEITESLARDVQVELTLPPGLVAYKGFGEEKLTNAPRDAQHLAPGDTMIVYRTLRACSTDLEQEDVVQVKVSWNEPGEKARRDVVVSKTIGELLQTRSANFIKARSIIVFAEALKDGSPAAIEYARNTVDAAFTETNDSALAELLEMAELHPALSAK